MRTPVPSPAAAPRRASRRRGTGLSTAAGFGLLLLFASGCAVPQNVREGDLKGRVFTVEESSLDWLEIAYTPRRGDPDFEMPCRLSLFGSGEMVFRTGRSPQVWDDFSTKTGDPDWNDIRIDRRHIGGEAMTELLQSFVDAGVVPSPYVRMTAGDAPKPPMAKIRGKIAGKAIARMVDNRKVVKLVERQLLLFGGR